MTFYRLQIKHVLLYWQEEPCNLLKRQGRDSFRVYCLTDFISSHAITLSHQRVSCQLRFPVDPPAAYLILATIQEARQAWSVINSPRAHTNTKASVSHLIHNSYTKLLISFRLKLLVCANRQCYLLFLML